MNFRTFLVVLSWIVIEGMLIVSRQIQEALIVAFIIIIIQQCGINKLHLNCVKYKGLFNAYKEMYSNNENKNILQGAD